MVLRASCAGISARLCARRLFQPFTNITTAKSATQLPDLRFTPLPPFGQPDALATLAHSIALRVRSPFNLRWPPRPDVTIVFSYAKSDVAAAGRSGPRNLRGDPS